VPWEKEGNGGGQGRDGRKVGGELTVMEISYFMPGGGREHSCPDQPHLTYSL